MVRRVVAQPQVTLKIGINRRFEMARARDIRRRRTPVPPAARGEFIMEAAPETDAIGGLAERQMAERRQFAEVKARHAEEGIPLPQALGPQADAVSGSYEQQLARREHILTKAREHGVPSSVVMNQLKMEGLDDLEAPTTKVPTTLEAVQAGRVARGEIELPEAYAQIAKGKVGKTYEPPAIIKEAKWLVDEGIAKTAKDAYGLVKEAKDKKLTREDFLAKGYIKILENDMIAGDAELENAALQKLEEFYDTKISPKKIGGKQIKGTPTTTKTVVERRTVNGRKLVKYSDGTIGEE